MPKKISPDELIAPETPVSYSTNEIRYAASKFKIKIAIFELRSNIDGHDRKSYPKNSTDEKIARYL
jgi:hypothetical protein